MWRIWEEAAADEEVSNYDKDEDKNADNESLEKIDLSQIQKESSEWNFVAMRFKQHKEYFVPGMS